MSQFIHNEEEVPLGDDVHQGQRTDNQDFHIVPNNLRIGPQISPTNSAKP